MTDPVVIVGGGPVGVAAGLLLARWEVPAVVLEATDRAELVGSRAICFQRDVLDVLDRVGCAERVIDRGVVWRTARTYYRDHELFAVTFPDPSPGRGADGGAVPPWVNISQTEVEQELLDAAARNPLVEVRFGYQATGYRETAGAAGSAAGSAAGGVEVDATTPDGPVTVRGSYLVGADGLKSTIRRLAGVDFPGRSFADRFLIADIRAELPFPSERRFYFDPPWNPGRQVLVHPQPDGVWRIDWQVPEDFDVAAEQASGALAERIRRIVGERPYEIVWLTVYRFHQRVASSFVRGRVVLAGDAAHLYAPFGARGLNSGLQDADNLAWKLAWVLRGWAPERLLDSYQAERRPAALENLRVTGDTMRFLVPQSEQEWERRRSVLERAVTDPAARSLINSGKLAEPYWYLDSPLTTPTTGAHGDALLGGQRFPTEPGAVRPPVPGVLCPDGPCVVAGERTRLRRLLGRGMVMLAGSAGGLAAAEWAAGRVGCPVTVHDLGGIDVDGVLGPALGASAGTVHVVRPDGHLAAVLPEPDPEPLAAALRRACGLPPGDPDPPGDHGGAT